MPHTGGPDGPAGIWLRPSVRRCGDGREAIRGVAGRAAGVLICSMLDIPASLNRKLVPAAEVRGREWPRPLVFTNGVFDVLHRGHVVYLAAARELGAALLVAVNSDSSARQLGKGPERPLNDEID